MENQIQKSENKQISMSSTDGFALVQRMAQVYSQSTMVPKEYQANIPNCVVAIDMAIRMGMSAPAVMQNLSVVQGRPSWNSTFIISSVNSSGRFDTQLMYEYEDLGQTVAVQPQNKYNARQEVTIQNLSCRAYAIKSNIKVFGPRVTVEMAVQEGWYLRGGSKWPNMPELMLSYRAAAFFGRLHAPELLNGLHTADEVQDSTTIDAVFEDVTKTSIIEQVNARVNAEKVADTVQYAEAEHAPQEDDLI